MNTFLKIQLNRACYVSLLNINDTQKGIIEYKNYIKKLNLLSINPFCLMKCLKEKQQAKNIFVEQMKKIAKKFFEEKNYVKAQECYQAIFEVDSKDVENIRNYIVCLEKLEQKDLQLSLAKELIKLNKEQQDYKIISNAYLNVEDYKNAICYYKKRFKF